MNLAWNTRKPRAPGAGTRGSIMLEFIFAFPLVLILLLVCIQLAHVLLVRQVVFYAAYCAARATLVSNTSEYRDAAKQAAEQVCAWVVKGQMPGEKDKVMSGWGTIPGSGGVGRKTRVNVQPGTHNVTVTVELDFALIVPIAGPIIGWAINPFDPLGEWAERRADVTGNIGDVDEIRYAHIRFTETVSLPKPYVTIHQMDMPADRW